MSEKKIRKVTNRGPQPEELRLEQWEWLRVTLSNIGDAVITTDTNGYVIFLNPVAQTMTGWTQEDAVGKPIEAVFKIVNEETRLPVENPATKALRDGVVVGLANHSVLIAKDGRERPIDDSAAPTVDAAGQVTGVALVFRDVSQRKRLEQQVQDARAYADNILATLRDPFLVLDKSLQVVTANHAFYENFHVTPEETQGCFVYDLGNHQWDIPKLRTLLEEVLPQNQVFNDFEVEHEFATIGRKVMLLNARRIRRPGNNSELILLNIEDITERRLVQQKLEVSETRFRRLFEAAHDGILILDAASRKITHVNPFLTNLLDYPAEHFLGKELWEIGFLHDKLASQSAMQQLDEQGEIRYESLPLEDRHGSTHPVEMIANLYQEGHHAVIQCNIRDISARKQAKEIGPPATRPLRVLVVDDNEDTLLSFSMLLSESGHDVRTASDGPSAVQAAIDYRPDVVLLDIGLPGLTGYEIAKRIRQQPLLKDVMLVALTGYGRDSDRQSSLDAGFDHHLVKPAVLDQLQQILATVAELVTS